MLYDFKFDVLYPYYPKTKQTMQLKFQDETDVGIDISFDGELQLQMETIILDSQKVGKMYTQQEIVQKISQKKGMKQKTPTKQKKELRLGFQSKELRQKFQEVIKEVPGRTDEAIRIFDFIAISENGTTTPLCLNGNTGCGKTSLISRQTRIRYSKPAIWSMHDKLKYSIGKEEDTKIIVLDEIDRFLDNQRFLYNILEWLWIGAKLIIVMISNVIDLTVHLDAKLQSRLKFQIMIFKPYSYQQLQDIFYYKYPQIKKMLEKECVTFIAKRISNVIPDIRILQKIYLRLEKEFKQDGGKSKLQMKHVNSIINESTRIPPALIQYVPILKILYKAEKKQDISQEIMHNLFLQSRENNHKPQTKDVLAILCDIRDCDLVSFTNKKIGDVTYYDYGIKIHQSLYNLLRENDQIL